MILCHLNENQSNRTSLSLQNLENLKVYSLLWLIHFCQHHLWRLHGSNLYRKIWSLPQYKVQEKFSFEYSALESLMGREKGKLKIYTHSNKKILQLFIPLKTLHSLQLILMKWKFPSPWILNNITSLKRWNSLLTWKYSIWDGKMAQRWRELAVFFRGPEFNS